MQTFLPYQGFDDSARVLDVRRLAKQRVETIQVLRALTMPGYGRRHHPVAAMWAGYEEALVRCLPICRTCGRHRIDSAACRCEAWHTERSRRAECADLYVHLGVSCTTPHTRR